MNQIRTLARQIYLRKNAKVIPYTLFLGAGAFRSSGCSTFLEIREYQEIFNVSLNTADQELSLLSEANELIRKETNDETYYILPEEGE